MEPIGEEGASSLAGRIIEKINELIKWVTDHDKADTAWKAEAVKRFATLEENVRQLNSENKGLRISRGKTAAARQRAEAKLEEARRLLH